jgi:hypothetical protein
VRRIVRAVLLVFVLGANAVSAAPPPARPKASKDDLARARQLDREGAKAYGAGRFSDAIRFFEEAYRLGGPAFELWNVAKCYMRLDQPDQAGEMLERYLAIQSIPKEDRDEATKQLDAIKNRPSPFTVSSTPSGAQVSVDGKPIEGRTPISTTIPPGEHTVTVTGSGEPYTQKVDARYGRPVNIDATLTGGSVGGEDRPEPPSNPYDDEAGGASSLSFRLGLGLVLPKHGAVGGGTKLGFLAMGTFKVAEVGPASIGVGGLLAINGDSWKNRTGDPDEVEGCNKLQSPNSATALSLFGIGHASFPILPKLRAGGMAGLGIAGYLVDDLGGDLFVPTCKASPGVRPAVLFGTQLDYAITDRFRISAFPLTWQIQPAFAGARATPRDASGVWMRFGVSVGVGVDL